MDSENNKEITRTSVSAENPGAAPGKDAGDAAALELRRNAERRCRAIAVRIYDLDTRVDEQSGSTLGRTLISEKSKSINLLTRELIFRPQGEAIVSYMALIGNMARSLKDKKVRRAMMSEYNAIRQEILSLEGTVPDSDIGNPARMRLNPFIIRKNFGNQPRRKFTDQDRLVICIGRSYGCGGNDIGFKLADMLHIDYYDATVFRDVMDRELAERESAAGGKSFRDQLDEDRNLKGFRRWLVNFNRFHGLPPEDALFFNQSEYIIETAKKKDFVILGRCADVILRNAGIPHVSIFITAPFEERVRRTMEMQQLSQRDAARLIRRQDRQHARFYKRFTGLEWGSAVHYDLCINSASYGIDECVRLIHRVTHARVRDDLGLENPTARRPAPSAAP